MKKLKFLILVWFFTFGTVLFADITNGLVAHYEFENNISDSSGNGYNLSIQNGSEIYDSNGKYGKAFSFNQATTLKKDAFLSDTDIGTITFYEW
jgi:hypothetical protein